MDIIALFSGPGPNYNWILKDGRLSAELYGNTIGPYNRTNHSVTTVFDSHKWQNATDLSIARTVLHEFIHAFLLAYFANNPRFVNATYPRLVAAWNAEEIAGNTADLNVVHHAEMGQSWVGDVAWSLKQYGISQNYNLPDQFYQDMAWGGLETTREFLALPLADRQRIHDIIVREATGKNAMGNTVPQSGKKSGC